MHYTIVHMEECCKDLNMILDLEAEGNKYSVVYGSRIGPWSRRQFDSLPEAYKVFEKLASWMVFGLYSEKNRREFLETGTMNI